MTIYGKDRFSWKNDELYLNNKKTGYSVVFENYAQFSVYRIKFPEGDLSEDFYNLTRAKDNVVKYVMRKLNIRTEDSV